MAIMSMPQLVVFFERYAASFAAPMESGTTVSGVEQVGARFRVETNRGVWLADNVVIATGYSDVPYVPPLARRLSPRVAQIVPTQYRNPSQLSAQGVLVVGASATGVQLADEYPRNGTAGDAGRRTTPAPAADVPGPRHHVVARRDGRLARECGRRGQHSRIAQPTFPAARGTL